jgi:hypothetical protein
LLYRLSAWRSALVTRVRRHVNKPECATEAQDYSRPLEVEKEIGDRSDVKTQEISRLKEEENVAI